MSGKAGAAGAGGISGGGLAFAGGALAFAGSGLRASKSRSPAEAWRRVDPVVAFGWTGAAEAGGAVCAALFARAAVRAAFDHTRTSWRAWSRCASKAAVPAVSVRNAVSSATARSGASRCPACLVEQIRAVPAVRSPRLLRTLQPFPLLRFLRAHRPAAH